jgi:hypothetical protein
VTPGNILQPSPQGQQLQGYDLRCAFQSFSPLIKKTSRLHFAKKLATMQAVRGKEDISILIIKKKHSKGIW